jgi:hypothetical protein
MKKFLLLPCLLATAFAVNNANAETVKLPVTKTKTKKIKAAPASTKSSASTSSKSTNNESTTTFANHRFNGLNSNHLGDLQFIPNQGEVIASAELSARPNKVTATFKGKDTVSAKESNLVQEYKIKYGVLEKAAIALSFEHYLSGKKETEIIEQKKTINVKAGGFTDPVLSGTYRIMDQKSDRVNTDLTFAISPSLIKAEEASEDKNGSRGRGALMMQAKGEVGAKFQAFEASGNLSLMFEGEREIKDLSTSEKYKIDSATTIALGGALRHEFTDKFAAKGGVELTFVGEDKRTQAGTSFYTMDSFTRVGFLAEGQYNVIPEKFLTKLQLCINTEGSRSLKLGENKLEVDSSSSQVFLLGADFRF